MFFLCVNSRHTFIPAHMRFIKILLKPLVTSQVTLGYFEPNVQPGRLHGEKAACLVVTEHVPRCRQTARLIQPASKFWNQCIFRAQTHALVLLFNLCCTRLKETSIFFFLFTFFLRLQIRHMSFFKIKDSIFYAVEGVDVNGIQTVYIFVLYTIVQIFCYKRAGVPP